MKKFVLTLMIALLFSSVIASAENLVFITCEYPPFQFIKEGQPAGSRVEIIHKVCEHLGLTAKIQFFPWKRAMAYMKKGQAHAIFAARKTEERAAFMHYPSEPIGLEKNVLLARKGSGIKIKRLDDLEGRTVGVVRGYTYTSEFDSYKGIQRVVCDDDKQAVQMLAKGRVLLAAGTDEVIKYFCKQSDFEAETVYVLSQIPGYVAFSKKGTGPKGKSLVEKFSQTLRQLREEGVIQKIESKYF